MVHDSRVPYSRSFGIPLCIPYYPLDTVYIYPLNDKVYCRTIKSEHLRERSSILVDREGALSMVTLRLATWLWLMGWHILIHCSADIVQCCYLSSLLAEDYSYLVRNGDNITALRCLTAGRWKAFRIEGNQLGPPIHVTDFKSSDNSLTFTVDDATNTGYYYCVNEVDEAEI